MGKKGGWFYSVKKVLSLNSNKDEKSQKSKKKWATTQDGTQGVKLIKSENENSKHANSVALATTMVAAVEVFRLTKVPRHPRKSREEIAAIMIQTYFRGYLGRKELRALKGLVRLQSLIEGQSVKRQATTALRCMRTLARVRSHVRTRQILMSEQNRSLQKQIQQKHEKESQSSKSVTGDDFSVSTKSKEQMAAKEQYRLAAAMRREKALAYSFTRQRPWKNPLKPVNQAFMDSKKPEWSWSWLERWMAARPWDIRSTSNNNDRGTNKTTGPRIPRAKSQIEPNNDNDRRSPTPAKPIRPPIRRSTSTPPSKIHSTSSASSKITLQSPSPTQTYLSDSYKRHSIGASSSSSTDYEIFEISPPNPINKTSSQMPTRDRPRFPSNGTSDKGSAKPPNRRLSLQPSPARSRTLSGPPKVTMSPI
ncbi:IQ-domain 3 isoform 2 [Hibiscus syriacus]|uniref:IQ-domain 3 isoform 2 n=1 Tax=Hibiscus syriacus TaxID=106335 RepID=A0A6A2ZF82_HIBSY|nr:protein IQ-DOMAIN 1-like [Hibiscus syriacus]KAE8689585.1 IQ-domain 3 isoform 2 [Hibiscus syriacus]